ncbi:type I restriction enzyme HsdR N-terminal domain-containing protein [Sphaerisporangium aureirubrum]|uniref:Type I restriction enzyme HsdR N-terminal domain-containing protein n=1 Tax=Sphaerisporangium aureirubrum TaxID=1544736 RepID=A0ABW1ND15_9ACTN
MDEQAAGTTTTSDYTSTSPDPIKITGSESANAKKTPLPRTVPKWEADSRDRVRAAIRRYSKPLADLVARDANEGDTRLLVTDFLCDGLGYDKYQELTTEYQVKGEFADYGVRVEKQLVAFIEVKRCTQKLGIRHLRQVQMYAVNEGVEWMIVTNGQVWQVYHMTGGLPVIVDLALEVDLLGDISLSAKTDALFYLSKDAFKRRLIDELWKARAATSPKALAQVVMSEVVLESIRKEVRRQTSHNADTKDLARILREEVLRPDALP